MLPSLSPALPIAEIPNSGRTIGIVPFVMILVSSGVKATGKYISVFLVAIILLLNIHKYFVEYPNGLPAKNTPTARLIAAYIDTLPSETPVYLSSCCWEEWGQPEPKAIYYQLTHPKGRTTLLTIDTLPYLPGAVVIGPPKRDGELFSSVFMPSEH